MLSQNLLLSGIVSASICALALPLRAQTIDDPLIGACGQSGSTPLGTACVDNGTNIPVTSLTGFGYTISPGPNTGDYHVDFLVPTNKIGTPGSLTIAVTGTGGGLTNSSAVNATATLVSSTAWTTGNLTDYLHITNFTGPPNPLGAFANSSETTVNPGFNLSTGGFFVYDADLGATKLFATGNPAQPVLTASGSQTLSAGTYAVGFLYNSTASGPHQGQTITTAQSNAFILTNSQTPGGGGGGGKVPEPGTLVLLGPGLLGLWMIRRRRSS